MMELFILLLILPNALMVMSKESEDEDPPFQPKFILPLVLIRTQDKREFIHPTNLSAAIMKKANFMSGTTFSANKKGEQFFFCGCDQGNANLDNQYCTYELPKYEQGSEILTCVHEPVPFVQKATQMNSSNVENDDIPCETVHNQKGKMFAFVYEVKTNDDEKKNTFEVYRFCYIEETKRVLFTEHTLAAPHLLNSQLFEMERKKTYEMSDEGYNFFGTKYKGIKNLYNELEYEKEEEKQRREVIEETPRKKQRQELTEKTPITSKLSLSDQKLVPSNDMAFAAWRKTTFHFLNVREMEDEKMKLWDHISQLIRQDAIDKSREYHILTGAFDLTDYGKDENEPIQSPDLWIKLVHHKWKSLKEHNESIAIIMNHNPENDFVGRSIKNYCEENLCENAFVEKFPKIGGSVCCTGSLEKIEFYFEMGLKFDHHAPLKIDTFYEK